MVSYCQLKWILLFIVIVTFTLSIMFIYNIRIEGMKVRYDCPTSLDETSEGIFKLSFSDNKKQPNYFYSLEEYVKIIKDQQSKDITCPILSLNAQGDLQPSSLSPTSDERKIQLLLDASRDSDIYNVNQYPGFDPDNLYIGTNTPLDMMHDMEEKKKLSANAMNSNWGGNAYTQKLLDMGYYDDNTREDTI